MLLIDIVSNRPTLAPDQVAAEDSGMSVEGQVDARFGPVRECFTEVIAGQDGASEASTGLTRWRAPCGLPGRPSHPRASGLAFSHGRG